MSLAWQYFCKYSSLKNSGGFLYFDQSPLYTLEATTVFKTVFSFETDLLLLCYQASVGPYLCAFKMPFGLAEKESTNLNSLEALKKCPRAKPLI